MLEIIKYGEDEYDFPCLLVLGCFCLEYCQVGINIGYGRIAAHEACSLLVDKVTELLADIEMNALDSEFHSYPPFF